MCGQFTTEFGLLQQICRERMHRELRHAEIEILYYGQKLLMILSHTKNLSKQHFFFLALDCKGKLPWNGQVNFLALSTALPKTTGKKSL